MASRAIWRLARKMIKATRRRQRYPPAQNLIVYRFRQLARQPARQPPPPRGRQQKTGCLSKNAGRRHPAPGSVSPPGDFFQHRTRFASIDGNTHHDDAPDGRGHRRIAREQTACAFICGETLNNEEPWLFLSPSADGFSTLPCPADARHPAERKKSRTAYRVMAAASRSSPLCNASERIPRLFV